MDKKVPKLLVIRSLPGSGKSTLAKKLADKYGIAHFENDQFLMHGNDYIWTPDAAKAATKKCYDAVMSTLKDGKDCIVANVFITVKAVNRYANEAKKLGAEVKVLRKTSQYKNVHDVPEHVFNSMKRQFQDYPEEEKVS